MTDDEYIRYLFDLAADDVNAVPIPDWSVEDLAGEDRG